MCFDFNMTKYKDELIPEIIKRVKGILNFEKVEYDSEETLKKLVEKHFPSIRTIIATLQQYAQTHDKIDSNILTEVNDEELSNMLLEKKPLNEIRNYIDKQNMNYTDVFHSLFLNFTPKCKKKAQSIILLADYENRCGMSSDPSLQIAACIVELLGCV